MKKKITLKSHLMLTFTVTVIVVAIVVGMISSLFISKNSKEQMVRSDHWLVLQLCENAAYLSEQASQLSANLAFNKTVQKELIKYVYGENTSLNSIKISINNVLIDNNRYNLLSDCADVVIFEKDGQVVGSKGSYDQNISIEAYEWFEIIKKSYGSSLWLPINYDENSQNTQEQLTIPIVRKIYSVQSDYDNTLAERMTVGKELGYVLIFINVDMYSNLVADDLPGKKFYLVDDENTIISAKNTEKLGQKFTYSENRSGYVTYDGVEYLMTMNTIEERGWHYICLTSKEEVLRESKIVVSVCVAITAVLILAFLVMGGLLSKTIGKPLNVLRSYFKQAENENVVITESTNIAECQDLYNSFNQAMTKIHALAKEVFEGKLRHQELVTTQKESQIQALQMQINPHFLYNTLDCINWKCRMDGNAEASEMIQILGQFFRSNTEVKGNLTTLKEEIKNIELYISLSKLRFGARLHCFIDIDQSLYECTVIKLLLQPFVENSIKYGLESDLASENIWIWAGEDDGELVISIKDDGTGIEKKKLKEIRNLWKNIDNGYVKTESIGIYNVMRRLNLHYKPACNFEIFSEKGIGTEVVITFPLSYDIPSSAE